MRSTPWQNPFDPLDVDEDGRVTEVDLNLLTAELEQNGPRSLPVSSLPDVVDRFWDVSGDNQLTRADVWLVNFALFQDDPTQGRLFVTTAADNEFTGTVDPLDLSLREALAYANAAAGHQTIVVDNSLTGQVLHLTHGQLEITDDVTLVGLGANETVISARDAEAASATSRVLSITAPVGQSVDVVIDGLTIADGKTGSNQPGGGISSDHITVVNSTLSSNEADISGGGIFSYDGALVVANSTISGNETAGIGGGIRARFGQATLSNSTIAYNHADGQAGGIGAPTTLTVRNSILALNTAGGAGPDLLASGGDIRHSLIGDNTGTSLAESRTPHPATGNLVGDPSAGGLIAPGLSPLGDFGGPTQTHVLLSNSPAIDAGNNAYVPSDPFDQDGDGNVSEPLPFDQRGSGFVRVLNGDASGAATVDMGAVELFAVVLTLHIVDAAIDEDGGTSLATVTRGGDLSSPVTVVLQSSDSGEAVVPLSVTIQANQATSPPFFVTGQRDFTVDGPQIVTITASAGGHTTGNDSVSVIDVDTAALTVEDVSATEGDGLTFTVTLDHAVAGGAQVQVTLAGGTATGGARPLVEPEDYDNVVGTLTFNGTAGEQRQFTVSTLDDNLLEDTETFIVGLQSTNPLATASDTAVGTITDNSGNGLPFVTLQMSAPAIPEAGGVTTVTVRLVDRFGQPTSAGDDGVSVSLALGGSAARGLDYVASATTIDIPAGQDRGSLTLTAVLDSASEPNESLTVSVTQAENANIDAAQDVSATIIDDDPFPGSVVLMTLEITDAAGNPLPGNRVTVGEAFRLNAVVHDVRAVHQGVFAAYLDVAYPDAAAFSVLIPEQQRLILPRDATGGTYALTFRGESTGPIPLGATPAASAEILRRALEDHSEIGDGNVRVTNSSRTEFTDDALFQNFLVFDIQFQQDLAHVELPQLTANGSQLQTVSGQTAAMVEPVADGGSAGNFARAFVPGSVFGAGVTGMDEPPEFSEVGSFCRQFPCTSPEPGDRSQLLWSVVLRADAAGSIEFVGNPADDQVVSDVLVLGEDQAVPTSSVVYGAAQVHVVERVALDYGDAEDPRYRSSFARDGARHAVSALRLGSQIDAELDALSSLAADGDGPDDDGVVWPASIVAFGSAATTSNMFVTSSGTGMLDAWIDFNRDGDWSDPGEQVATSLLVGAGLNPIAFPVPAGAIPRETVARVRLSSQGGLAPTGPALDGEVEDYRIVLLSGDAGGGSDARIELPFAGTVRVAGQGPDVSVTLDAVELFRARGHGLSRIDIVAAGGNDSIEIENLPAGFNGRVTIDGGAGDDVLILAGGDLSFNLVSRPGDLRRLETIDLRGAGNHTLRLDVNAVVQLPDLAGRVTILADQGDSVDVGDGWSLMSTETTAGRFFRVVQPSATPGAVALYLHGPRDWQNPLNRLDVNADGNVVALDALQIINELNHPNFRDPNSGVLIDASSLPQFPRRFYDVTGDNAVTPIDVLLVINYLNGHAAGESESESDNANLALLEDGGLPGGTAAIQHVRGARAATELLFASLVPTIQPAPSPAGSSYERPGHRAGAPVHEVDDQHLAAARDRFFANLSANNHVDDRDEPHAWRESDDLLLTSPLDASLDAQLVESLDTLLEATEARDP